MNERWLIISYFANVDGLAPSHHLDDRLPWLQRRGVEFMLLTSPCGAQHRAYRHWRVPSPAPSGLRYELRYFLRRQGITRGWFKFYETLLLLPLLPFYLLEKLVLKLDSTWSWFLTSAAVAVFAILRRRPAVIYSTGGPSSAHVAAAVAARLARVPCVVEFQDPLTYYKSTGRCWERRLIERVEKYLFCNAAAVVFLTRNAAARASAQHASGAQVAAIYAGADPLEGRVNHEASDTFRIAHFGSLAGSRNLAHFLAALESLLDENPQWREHVTVQLYGSNDREVLAQVDRCQYRQCIAIAGKVPRREALDAMQRADLLLLVQNTDAVSSETIPSKVYEYLNTRRPILALVYRNEELRSMLAELDHDTAEGDDDCAIKETLRVCLARWERGEARDAAPASQYATERAADELIELVHRATASRMKGKR